MDVLQDGRRLWVGASRLRKGRARFRLPDDVRGLVAVQASTHFAAQGESVTVRHLWVTDGGNPTLALIHLGVAAGVSEAEVPMFVRALLAARDAVRYPAPVLVDGGAQEERRLARLAERIQHRSFAGIGLAALAEAFFLVRLAIQSRRRTQALLSAVAKETGAPPADAGWDWMTLAALLAAAATGFAVMAALAVLLS